MKKCYFFLAVCILAFCVISCGSIEVKDSLAQKDNTAEKKASNTASGVTKEGKRTSDESVNETASVSDNDLNRIYSKRGRSESQKEVNLMIVSDDNSADTLRELYKSRQESRNEMLFDDARNMLIEQKSRNEEETAQKEETAEPSESTEPSTVYEEYYAEEPSEYAASAEETEPQTQVPQTVPEAPQGGSYVVLDLSWYQGLGDISPIISGTQAMCSPNNTQQQNMEIIGNYMYTFSYTDDGSVMELSNPIYVWRSHRAFCQGLAYIYTVMCRSVGIDCHTVQGIVRHSGSLHNWNVMADGSYVDWTWRIVNGTSDTSHDIYFCDSIGSSRCSPNPNTDEYWSQSSFWLFPFTDSTGMTEKYCNRYNMWDDYENYKLYLTDSNYRQQVDSSLVRYY